MKFENDSSENFNFNFLFQVSSSDSESDVVIQKKKKADMSKNAAKKKKNKIDDSDSNNGEPSGRDSYQSDDSMSSMEVLPSKNRKRVVRPKDSSEEEEYGDAKPPPKVLFKFWVLLI